MFILIMPLLVLMTLWGFKQSGNGREWGIFGFEEFLEIKAVMGYAQAKK